MKICLSWPDKRLSPNARLHHMAKASLVRKARAEAWGATLEAAGRALGTIRSDLAGTEPIALSIRFTPPDNRRRDRDNMQHSAKHLLDGIAQALQVNDYRFRPSYDFAAPRAPGSVVVEIGG